MAVIDLIAKELEMEPNELLQESLKIYLARRLIKVETEIFRIAKRHGVKEVSELDSRIREGIVSEKEAFEDYFALDHLEAEKERISKSLEKL
ncbi:MAG: hypothetical protein HXY45_15000 [Syntrophaceae bacterium]|nr:hypothetical protein [Syntrophaceae bacterium]